MTKKILLISGILVIVGLVVFFIFFSKPTSGPGESRVGFFIRDFLPFGKSVDTETATSTETETGNSTTNEPSVTTNQPVPRLRKISNEPVAGAVIFNVGATSTVRFVEKGTGNVYEVKSDSITAQRLTNTTIPKIIRAFWLPNGSGFLAQTLMIENEIVETNFVRLNKNKASTTVEILTPFSTTISKLPTNIKEITVKPDSSKIFYYTVSGALSNWFTANPDGTGAMLVMTHPLTEWLPKWLSGNTVLLQSKSSAEIMGFTYTFDVSSKTLKKSGLGARGLSVNPNPLGDFSLISSGGTFPELALVNNKAVTSTEVAANTFAEKCVWLQTKNPTVYCAIPNQTPRGDYPDDWYQGLVSTEDSIEKLDISNDIFYKIADLSDLSQQKIDVTDISLSPDETHLIFRNKIDGYLWMLRIGE